MKSFSASATHWPTWASASSIRADHLYRVAALAAHLSRKAFSTSKYRSVLRARHAANIRNMAGRWRYRRHSRGPGCQGDLLNRTASSEVRTARPVPYEAVSQRPRTGNAARATILWLKNANVGAQCTELTMRTLLIPAVGLAFALGLAAPTASFAATKSTGTTHTTHSKSHSKACHPTATHHCPTAKKSTHTAKK